MPKAAEEYHKKLTEAEMFKANSVKVLVQDVRNLIQELNAFGFHYRLVDAEQLNAGMHPCIKSETKSLSTVK